MYIFTSESENIDWTKEPDINEYRQLFELSNSDPKAALPGLEKLAARGSVASMLHLASGYMRGIPENRRDYAKRWYSLASNKEHQGATMVYGRLCLDDKEYNAAKTAFEKVAKLGDPTALYMLGSMRLKGLGDAPSKEQGVALLTQSSVLGSSFATRDLVILMLSGKLGLAGWLKGFAMLIRLVAQTIGSLQSTERK